MSNSVIYVDFKKKEVKREEISTKGLERSVKHAVAYFNEKWDAEALRKTKEFEERIEKK